MQFFRCTKIIAKDAYDYSERANCYDYRSSSCKHVWTKNGVVLTPGDKYKMKSSITFDYCETFEWTSDIVKALHVEVRSDGGESYYQDSDMKCFASALTITNVTPEDLGEYQCHLVSENGDEEPASEEPLTVDNVQNITVADIKSVGKLPKKIEYFENFYTKGIKSKLLMQCVVTGGPVHWFLRFETEDCNRWEDMNGYNSGCPNETMRPIDKHTKLDGWHCFNFSVNDHQPYDRDDVTESFIYFENICKIDWAGLYCSADSNGTIRSKAGQLVLKEQWDGEYYWWYTEDAMRVMGWVGVPIILSCFFIVGAILACVRGKICSCCGGAPSLPYGYRVAPQTFTYVVPTQVPANPVSSR